MTPIYRQIRKHYVNTKKVGRKGRKMYMIHQILPLKRKKINMASIGLPVCPWRQDLKEKKSTLEVVDNKAAPPPPILLPPPVQVPLLSDSVYDTAFFRSSLKFKEFSVRPETPIQIVSRRSTWRNGSGTAQHRRGRQPMNGITWGPSKQCPTSLVEWRSNLRKLENQAKSNFINILHNA